MDNIYSQTEMERNSIVEIPDGYAKKAGDTLYAWLGSLWRTLNRGDGMVRGVQSARGIRLAQMYLDVLEAAKLQDRNGAPVFHRELWHPIIIRRSMRDRAEANLLRMGGDVLKIGEQPEGSPYGEGTVLKMGRMAGYADHVTYPVGAEVAGGAMAIVDNIVNPGVFMERGEGKDFDIRDGSIIFPSENDPLADGSPFEKYDVPSDDPSSADVECVLWASDVLIDRNYVSDHISYALGANAPSRDVVKRILNAAWSSFASGLTPELVKTLLAAMLNVPVIQNESETVVDVRHDEDSGATLVVTDRITYRVSPKATLMKYVKRGAVLKRGDLLDESLRIYPYLNTMPRLGSDSDSSFGNETQKYGMYSVPLEMDIPSVTLGKGMMRAKTEFGVYAMWGMSQLKRKGDGNPNHVYFDIGGDPKDVDAFWKYVWDMLEKSGMTMESIIGEGVTEVSPAEFFIKNLIGANTIFVSIDRSQADDTSMIHDPMFFDILTEVVPSAIRLVVVEHTPVSGEDLMDLGTDSEESEAVSAALPNAVDDALASSELVSFRIVRPAPAKTRGHKEEE